MQTQSDLQPAKTGPKLRIHIRYSGLLGWWCASLIDAETERPFRASVGNVVAGWTYEACLSAAEIEATKAGATWTVVDSGEEFLRRESAEGQER